MARERGRAAGQDRLDLNAPNVQLLLHAYVTHINTNSAGTRFESAEVRTLGGKRAWVKSKAFVLRRGRERPVAPGVQPVDGPGCWQSI